MEEKKSLIILSGGMDSVTLLYDKAQEIALAVTFIEVVYDLLLRNARQFVYVAAI